MSCVKPSVGSLIEREIAKLCWTPRLRLSIWVPPYEGPNGNIHSRHEHNLEMPGISGYLIRWPANLLGIKYGFNHRHRHRHLHQYIYIPSYHDVLNPYEIEIQ
jgi:hypothetical protein